jgi:AmiR/NasT family two-component response regulator
LLSLRACYQRFLPSRRAVPSPLTTASMRRRRRRFSGTRSRSDGRPRCLFSLSGSLTAPAQRLDVNRLRVLVANERQDRLAVVAAVVAGLGHDVIAPQIEVSDVGPVTAREQPDVAFVGLGASSQHALELIEQIVHEAACPVVALLHEPDPGFVVEAARRGIFAYITDGDPQEWQNSIEIVLRRFAEFRDLEGAFKRRAITERAKGILMERHAVDEERAFQMLRDHARNTQTVLVETAQSIIDGRLLTKEP